MERATEVGPLEQARELASLGGGELAVVLAQLRLDVSQIQCAEDVFLRVAGQAERGVAGLLGRAEEAVFVEAQAARDGPLAHDDVVLLAAGEVGEREGILRVAHHAQVGLDAALDNHAGLGVALRADAEHAGLRDEELDDLGGLARGDEEINVANGFLPAAQTAGGAAPRDIGMLAEAFQNGRRDGERLVQMVLAGELALEGDAFENLRLRLLAEAIEHSDLARLARGFERLDGVHAQLVVELLDLLRPEAGDAEHLDEAGRDGGFQLVVVGEVPGGDELGDLVHEGIAEALEFAEALLGDEFLQRLGQALQRACGVLVGAGLEGVLALEFEEGANLGEHGGDLLFVHAAEFSEGVQSLKG